MSVQDHSNPKTLVSTAWLDAHLRDPDLRILDGFYTPTQFRDAAGNLFTVPSVNGGLIGAVTASDDWTAGWTVGLDDELWF